MTFEEWLQSTYKHHPKTDEECEFGEHWWCSCYEGPEMYSFSEWVTHAITAWKAES